MPFPVRCRERRGRADRLRAAMSLAGLACASAAHAQTVATVSLDRVEVTASRPATMPIEIPTTVESITGKEIERSINATDAGDALKYFPSLSVRKRYIGDYDHAVLATRASGTGNSARSLVYADGILLSNLLGNGAGFTPRWGLVTPEEIERIDVLTGRFSAAYSGSPWRSSISGRGWRPASGRTRSCRAASSRRTARQVPGQRRPVAAARAALAHGTARDLCARRALVDQHRAALFRGPVRAARQLRHQRLRIYRLQQVPRCRSCAPNTGSPGRGSFRPASTISPTRATGRSTPTHSAPTTPSSASISDQQGSQRQDLP
jgi:hypothetical protein